VAEVWFDRLVVGLLLVISLNIFPNTIPALFL